LKLIEREGIFLRVFVLPTEYGKNARQLKRKKAIVWAYSLLEPSTTRGAP